MRDLACRSSELWGREDQERQQHPLGLREVQCQLERAPDRARVAERVACGCLEQQRLDHPALPDDRERARIDDRGERGDRVLRSTLVERTSGGHEPYLCSVATGFVEFGERPLDCGDIARA